MPRAKQKTEDMTIFMILDGSGSMEPVQGDVIAGVNHFIDEQKKEKGKTKFFLTTFDTNVRRVFEDEDIHNIPTLDRSHTYHGGGTALLDAIGKTITTAETKQLIGKKLTVIYTDGEENSSREFDKPKIKALIERLEGTGEWTFAFMSADVDNFDEARAMGISAGNYMATDSSLTQHSHGAFAASTSTLRSSASGQTGTFYADAGINDVDDIANLTPSDVVEPNKTKKKVKK